MKLAVPKARKEVAQAADSLEKIAQGLWPVEARLTAASEIHAEPGAGDLAGDLACVLVDHLHPAIEALRKASEDQP